MLRRSPIVNNFWPSKGVWSAANLATDISFVHEPAIG
jgi:hypothetical protein